MLNRMYILLNLFYQNRSYNGMMFLYKLNSGKIALMCFLGKMYEELTKSLSMPSENAFSLRI